MRKVLKRLVNIGIDTNYGNINFNLIKNKKNERKGRLCNYEAFFVYMSDFDYFCKDLIFNNKF